MKDPATCLGEHRNLTVRADTLLRQAKNAGEMSQEAASGLCKIHVPGRSSEAGKFRPLAAAIPVDDRLWRC
jgi:hypothetical protein